MKNKLLPFVVLHLGLAAVVAQPVITNQPQDQTAIAGATATYSVRATGTPPLSYQWRRHTNAIASLPGETNAILVLIDVQPTSHRFSVIVTDGAGLSATSALLARLTVVTPPSITPANPTASLFADLTLVGSNAPAGPVSYQWLFNGEPIAGAVTNKLVVTNVQKTNAGNYAIVATYAFGSATSQVATLKIVPFNSMYCFGFSYTDTHNCTWPPSYWQNHPSNGPMWPEFLSTSLGLAYAESNNYAHCGSSVGARDQVISFPIPAKPQLSLYCFWLSGAIPVATNEAAWAPQFIQADIPANSNIVNRLYEKGARTILVEGQFEIPSDLVIFGTNIALLSRYLEVTPRLNEGFREAMNASRQTRPDLRLVYFDMISKLSDVLANPAQYGFTKTDISALEDMSLTDKSFTGPGADYLFWDSVEHPTSEFHQLLAA